MGETEKLKVKFYRTAQGNEPVREWLSDSRKVKPEDRKTIGEDIKTVQFGWTIGMPLVEKVEPDLWSVRSHISAGIVRILFTVQEDMMVLLHGFIKKSRKIPKEDLELARKRKAELL